MKDGRRCGDGSGWGRGRGEGRGMGRGMGRGFGRGRGSGSNPYSTSRRDSTRVNQMLDVSSKILALKTHARTIVNRLRGIDQNVYKAEDTSLQRPAPEKEPLDRTLNAKRGPTAMVAVVDQVQCIRCGLCVEVCPEQAVSLQDDVVAIDADKCVACGACVEDCASEAISLKRRKKSVVP